MGFFIKKDNNKVENHSIVKSDIIDFQEINSADDVILCTLATKIKDGLPIILNLEHLTIDEINKTIAFLSGVCYALDGDVYQIKERDKVFLFGDKDLYKDGSIKNFLKIIEGVN